MNDFRKDIDEELERLSGFQFVLNFALIGFLSVFAALVILLTIHWVKA